MGEKIKESCVIAAASMFNNDDADDPRHMQHRQM